MTIKALIHGEQAAFIMILVVSQFFLNLFSNLAEICIEESIFRYLMNFSPDTGVFPIKNSILPPFRIP